MVTGQTWALPTEWTVTHSSTGDSHSVASAMVGRAQGDVLLAPGLFREDFQEE